MDLYKVFVVIGDQTPSLSFADVSQIPEESLEGSYKAIPNDIGWVVAGLPSVEDWEQIQLGVAQELGEEGGGQSLLLAENPVGSHRVLMVIGNAKTFRVCIWPMHVIEQLNGIRFESETSPSDLLYKSLKYVVMVEGGGRKASTS